MMGLSKIAIIAAQTKESRSTSQQSFSIATVFTPMLMTILRCQQLLGIATLSLHRQACWLVWQIFQICSIIANKAHGVLRGAQYHAVVMIRTVWEARFLQSLRKKIAFELFTLFLGAGGNSLCLLLFWPGWWVVALLGVTGRMFLG
ncbi:uncharacterized protein GGS22DRAFT_136 [Annulohypoxylon maeteangense]|uniref:uncharacterized protein n=1 Tax=Annulohypoxylon maeteangense TaxID=1927788 RepID=UPI00200881BE|nr:uncharacterized protein GGS22DRAFT_136 [Annulohypoxylon maeteangense]KAI0889494.1 hypothetical protein GGS22DRAFT_136 [Annulohypoxylon maeteangense]